jgi:hypothetical protein
MASVFGWLYLIIGVGGIIDAFVHPQSDWIHADRNRPFWVIMMFCFSIFAVVPYLIGVRPRFGGSGGGEYKKIR